MGHSGKSTAKGSIIYTAGQLLTKATGFFLIPLYTRFLSPSDFGIIGYINVVLQVLAIVLMFGLYGAQRRFYYEYNQDKEELGRFLGTVNLYLILVVGSIALIISLWGESLYNRLPIEDIPFHPFVVYMAWIAFFRIMNQMMITYYMAAKEFRKAALLQFVQFLFITGMIIFFVVYRQGGARGKVLGQMLGQGVFFVLFYPFYARLFKWTLDWQKLKVALTYGLPMVIQILAGALHNMADRVILKQYISLDELGIYTVGYQIGMVMSIVVSSINKAWQPNYFEGMKKRTQTIEKEVRSVFSVSFFAILGITVVGIFWTREIITVLVPDSYFPVIRIIPIIIGSYLFQGLYFFSSMPMFYYKKTKMLPVLTVLSVLVNIGLNLLWIPKWGMLGAAYATLFSLFFQSIITQVVARRIHDHHYPIIRTVILSFLCIGLGLYLSTWEINLRTELLKVVTLMALGGIAFWVFRKELKGALNGVKRTGKSVS